MIKRIVRPRHVPLDMLQQTDRDALIEMRVDAGTAQTLANLAAYLPQIVGQRCL